MKRAEINAILDNTSIKDLVNSQRGCAWTIRRLLSKELGDTKCPSEPAIKTYIKNYCNLVWDEEKDLWISSKKETNPAKKSGKKRGKKSSEILSIRNKIKIENNNSTLGHGNLSINENPTDSNLSEKSNKEWRENSNLLESKNEEKIISNSAENKTTNSAKKCRKKGRKKSTETFTKTHELEIDDNDNYIPKDEDLSISRNSRNSNPSEKVDEKFAKNRNLLESINEEKDMMNIEYPPSNSKPKSRYKNIDPSQYPVYIELYGNEKYSLSLSPFVIEVIEGIILEKYNNMKMSKSKIVQLALMEFMSINTKVTSKVENSSDLL